LFGVRLLGIWVFGGRVVIRGFVYVIFATRKVLISVFALLTEFRGFRCAVLIN
jgi:hypothetical protein